MKAYYEGLLLKIKNMRREPWQRVKKKEYISRAVTAEEGKILAAIFSPEKDRLEGVQSILRILSISQPLIITYPDRSVKIADEGYSWVQTALEGEHFWITTMFDPDGELTEIYFDINTGNDLSCADDPCFTDMYLDIVTDRSGKVFVLDRDELDEALMDKKITRSEYDRALADCEKLLDTVKSRRVDIWCYYESVFRSFLLQ